MNAERARADDAEAKLTKKVTYKIDKGHSPVCIKCGQAWPCNGVTPLETI